MSADASARDPARVRAGDLLAAAGELAAGRAAEVYAACGYPVLPCFAPTPDGGCTCRGGGGCDRPGKHPCIRGGVHQASTDLGTVRRWWRRWPNANIALCTGPGSFDVADVDGPQGVEALRALLTHAAAQPVAGPLAHTGGGGWHLLFAPTGMGSPTGVLGGVDWRGRGGYILAAPSRHPSGGRYRWVRPLSLQLPEVPTPLRRLLTPPPPQPAPRPPAATMARVGGGYGTAALLAECARVRATPPGGAGRKGRNDALNRAAFKLGQLVHAGLLDHSVVRAALLEAAAAAGLAQPGAARTINKAVTAAARKPPQASSRRALLP